MNVGKVSICNFGGIEGVVEFDLDAGLTLIPSHYADAIMDGLRYVLDRTFIYENPSHRDNQYVAVSVKQADSVDGAVLRIFRSVDDSDNVVVNQSHVSAQQFFVELGESMGNVDMEWMERVTHYTGRDWLACLLRPEVAEDDPGQVFNPEFDINSSGDGALRLAETKALLSRRSGAYQQKHERNDLIKKARALDKCRKTQLKQKLRGSVSILSQDLQRISGHCQLIQTEIQESTWDMILDKKALLACRRFNSTEFYIFFSNSDLHGLWEEAEHGQVLLSSLIATINENQRFDLQSMLAIGKELWNNSRLFRLEELVNCLELSRLPEVNKRSLEVDAEQQSQRYSSSLADLQRKRSEIEDQIQSNERFWDDFKERGAYLRAEFEVELTRLDTICISCHLKVEKANQNEVQKLDLNCQREEVRKVLVNEDQDFASALQGLSSLLRLLEHEDYREVQQTEYLGPIFEWIKFKGDTDIFTKTFFRKQLKDWYFVVVVKSAEFAHRLLKDFNARHLPGTISILPCNSYRQRADPMEGGRTITASLNQVIDISDNHPFLNFFSGFVRYEGGDTSDSPVDADHPPGVLRADDPETLHTIEDEVWLQRYLEIDQELIELESIHLEMEEIEDEFFSQLQTINSHSIAFSQLMQSSVEVMHSQAAIQSELQLMAGLKRELQKIEWNKEINSRLIALIDAGQLKREPSKYEEQIFKLAKESSGIEGIIPLYDATETEDQLQLFRYLVDTLTYIPWPSVTSIVSQGFLYVDAEIPPHTESDLVCSIQTCENHRRRLREDFNAYLRTKRLRELYHNALTGLTIERSRAVNVAEHSSKSLSDLERELHRLAKEFNVYPTSAEDTRKRKNLLTKMRRLVETEELPVGSIEVGLLNFLSHEKSTMQLETLQKLWTFIKQFYDEVRPGCVDSVAPVYAVDKAKLSNGAYLAMKDLSSVALVFRTAEGNFRVDELSAAEVQVFGIAVLFGKVKLHNIPLVVLRRSVEALGAGTVDKILNLFISNHVQVVMEKSPEPHSTAFDPMEWE